MPTGLAGFIYYIVNGLLDVIVLCLIISAVLSWLVAFNVINTRNPIVWRILDIVDRITAPVLAPFRAVIPNIGGLDISYIVCFLVIRGIQGYLLLPAAMTLQQLIG
ncbi:YggT family protein [Asticcacaulis sp. EMRT-3]|uniref:YggT family protein n=1 Tax=Asticcacaulis sp. EMRT-3 TaxID=3040349 RepID=UPI0024AF5E55|nr:YggT family protein [Asticcacaulis sp. EMRT-3]MDI7775421.1 YggT family protein [Asticcacaulis sp. EMRT-3]